MSHILNKAVITLAAALGTAAASAQPDHNVWFNPHMNQHLPQPNYQQYPQHRGHPQPRYEPTPREKCENAVARQQPLAHRFRRTDVGFIEGRTFACKINLDSGRLTSSYNLQNNSGINSYHNALNNAARQEDRKRNDRYRDFPRW